MGFLYTRARPSQHILLTVVLALAVAAGLTAAVASAWSSLVQALPEWALVIGVTIAIHHVVFWGVSGLFTIVDRTDKPAFIAKHRIQDGKPRLPPNARVWRVLALNQLVFAPLMMALIYGTLLARGWQVEAELPSFTRLMLELVGMSISSIIFFYASHRFLHRPWWMKKVHRVHHEFRTTRAWASEYAHPVEFLVGNFGTLAVGVLLFAPHLATLWVYTVLAMLQILVHHAGYALPWAPWAIHHDWHHYRYKEAFGTIGILDKLLGTQPELSTLKDGDRR